MMLFVCEPKELGCQSFPGLLSSSFQGDQKGSFLGFVARNSATINGEFTFWNKHLGGHLENLVTKARKTSVNLR